MLAPFEWLGGIPGRLKLIDQRLLPLSETWVERRSVEEVFSDIRTLAVRGAPAIGVAAAYGVVIGAQGRIDDGPEAVKSAAVAAADRLAQSRPTAVNLFWALDAMRTAAALATGGSGEEVCSKLLDQARRLHAFEHRTGELIGMHGAPLVPDGSAAITHCNAGGLATTGLGTALSVFYAAKAAGKKFTVYADETRPLLQGARLTAYELARAGIEHYVICDGAAASIMSRGGIALAVVGADRIAQNGDAANKIGTLSLAVCAREFGVPFYVAAPTSTFDLSLRDGSGIPIEERAMDEVLEFAGKRVAPAASMARNPAFDVTPARLITGIITELGIIENPDAESVAAMLSKRQ